MTGDDTPVLVPLGWRVLQLRRMFARTKDVDHPDEQMLSVFRELGVVVKDDHANINQTAENRSIYQLVHPGWLVTNRMKAWQGSVGISAHRGIVSGHYLCFKPTHAEDDRYLNWLFRSRPYIAQYAGLSRGVRPGQFEIDNDEYSALSVVLPPRATQRAIADYLDRETAQIDTLIAKQEQLIATLRERREAMIATALQAGVNGDGPTTDSELGVLPAHWRVVPTRHLCTITTGDEDSGNATEDGRYPFFVRGREVLRSDRYTFDGEAVMTPGDGQGGTGKVFHYFHGRFLAHRRVYVFKDFRGVDGRYFYLYLSTFLRPRALANSNTVTMESLRRPVLADFKVAMPPLEEQRAIVASLDGAAARVDTLIAKAERFIELAKERRAALITAAVTGQIDVRAA